MLSSVDRHSGTFLGRPVPPERPDPEQEQADWPLTTLLGQLDGSVEGSPGFQLTERPSARGVEGDGYAAAAVAGVQQVHR
jgi:hypothetical protein